MLEGYEPGGPRDNTVTVLEATVRHLPRDGARNVSDDILGCNSDEKLRQLASHLLTAVLVPSQYIISIRSRYGWQFAQSSLRSESA